MPWKEWKALIVEIALALLIVAICAPGVIWWAIVAWEIVQ